MNIDTLSIARDLRATELPPEQAEAIAAAAIGRAVSESSATKADLDLVKASLEAKMDQGRAEAKADIEQVRGSLDSKIEQVRGSLEARIEQVRGSLETKIEQAKTEIERSRHQIILWVVSAQVALAGIIIAVIKL